MKLLLAGLTMLIATPAFAQFSPSLDECSKTAKTQLQINNCAGSELKRAESQLDERYRRLRSELGNDKLALQKLTSMQAAWSNYRTSYMDAMYPAEDKQGEYGTSYPAAAALAEARLTLQQTAAIDAILQLYKPR